MNKKDIDYIINDYKKRRIKYPDYSLKDCEAANNLQHAIEMAATARNLAGRKHPHQFRIPNSILQDFAQAVISIQREIAQATSFHLLYKLIDKCRIKGVSDLTIYDTAHRIGCFLKLFPEEIYLHSGTRKGAEILIGKIKGKTISVDQLPLPFQNGLSPSELEDMLCMYKTSLRSPLTNQTVSKC